MVIPDGFEFLKPRFTVIGPMPSSLREMCWAFDLQQDKTAIFQVSGFRFFAFWVMVIIRGRIVTCPSVQECAS